MSIPKIYVTEKKVADLDLKDPVLNSINEQLAFSEIDSKITDVSQQVLNVNNQLTGMQGTISQV